MAKFDAILALFKGSDDIAQLAKIFGGDIDETTKTLALFLDDAAFRKTLISKNSLGSAIGEYGNTAAKSDIIEGLKTFPELSSPLKKLLIAQNEKLLRIDLSSAMRNARDNSAQFTRQDFDDMLNSYGYTKNSNIGKIYTKKMDQFESMMSQKQTPAVTNADVDGVNFHITGDITVEKGATFQINLVSAKGDSHIGSGAGPGVGAPGPGTRAGTETPPPPNTPGPAAGAIDEIGDGVVDDVVEQSDNADDVARAMDETTEATEELANPNSKKDLNAQETAIAKSIDKKIAKETKLPALRYIARASWHYVTFPIRYPMKWVTPYWDQMWHAGWHIRSLDTLRKNSIVKHLIDLDERLAKGGNYVSKRPVGARPTLEKIGQAIRGLTTNPDEGANAIRIAATKAQEKVADILQNTQNYTAEQIADTIKTIRADIQSAADLTTTNLEELQTLTGDLKKTVDILEENIEYITGSKKVPPNTNGIMNEGILVGGNAVERAAAKRTKPAIEQLGQFNAEIATQTENALGDIKDINQTLENALSVADPNALIDPATGQLTSDALGKLEDLNNRLIQLNNGKLAQNQSTGLADSYAAQYDTVSKSLDNAVKQAKGATYDTRAISLIGMPFTQSLNVHRTQSQRNVGLIAKKPNLINVALSRANPLRAMNDYNILRGMKMKPDHRRNIERVWGWVKQEVDEKKGGINGDIIFKDKMIDYLEQAFDAGDREGALDAMQRLSYSYGAEGARTLGIPESFTGHLKELKNKGELQKVYPWMDGEFVDQITHMARRQVNAGANNVRDYANAYQNYTAGIRYWPDTLSEVFDRGRTEIGAIPWLLKSATQTFTYPAWKTYSIIGGYAKYLEKIPFLGKKATTLTTAVAGTALLGTTGVLGAMAYQRLTAEDLKDSIENLEKEFKRVEKDLADEPEGQRKAFMQRSTVLKNNFIAQGANFVENNDQIANRLLYVEEEIARGFLPGSPKGEEFTRLKSAIEPLLGQMNGDNGLLKKLKKDIQKLEKLIIEEDDNHKNIAALTKRLTEIGSDDDPKKATGLLAGVLTPEERKSLNAEKKKKGTALQKAQDLADPEMIGSFTVRLATLEQSIVQNQNTMASVENSYTQANANLEYAKQDSDDYTIVTITAPSPTGTGTPTRTGTPTNPGTTPTGQTGGPGGTTSTTAGGGSSSGAPGGGGASDREPASSDNRAKARADGGGASGNTGLNRDGYENKGPLDHLSILVQKGVDGAAVNRNDKVASAVDHFLHATGKGVKGGGKYLSSMFNNMKRTDNPEGQSWLGVGGGILSALVLQNFVVNKLLDKMGIGKIPLIGTAIKIASFIGLFMYGRKFTHDMLLQGDASHVDTDQITDDDDSDSGSDTAGESGGLSRDKQLFFRVQGHTGTLPQMIPLLDDIDDAEFFSDISAKLVNEATGEYVIQITADNGTTFSPEGFGTTVQGNSFLIPEELLEELENNKPTFEAIDHNADGTVDSFKLSINGQSIEADLTPKMKQQGMTFETLGN